MTQKTIPRYRAIADELINGIVSKKYAVGSALPAETDLCVQLQASRHTVRRLRRFGFSWILLLAEAGGYPPYTHLLSLALQSL